MSCKAYVYQDHTNHQKTQEEKRKTEKNQEKLREATKMIYVVNN